MIAKSFSTTSSIANLPPSVPPIPLHSARMPHHLLSDHTNKSKSSKENKAPPGAQKRVM